MNKNCPSRLPENKREYHKKYWLNNPWISHYQSAKDRCLRVKNAGYHRYGGKGVKFLMTTKDFKFLWERDKAHLMKEPSIDRIDSNGNYETNNCRFIEMKLNRYLGQMGSKHPKAKLHERDIPVIREMSKKYDNCKISRIYGVHSETIRQIIRGETWRHV